MVWWQTFIVTEMNTLSSIIALDIRYPFWGMAPHHCIIGNDYLLLQKKPGNSKNITGFLISKISTDQESLSSGSNIKPIIKQTVVIIKIIFLEIR